MATEKVTLDKSVRGILILLQRLVRERAHGQLIITVRDGEIILATVQHQYRPENIPEA